MFTINGSFLHSSAALSEQQAGIMVQENSADWNAENEPSRSRRDNGRGGSGDEEELAEWNVSRANAGNDQSQSGSLTARRRLTASCLQGPHPFRDRWM